MDMSYVKKTKMQYRALKSKHCLVLPWQRFASYLHFNCWKYFAVSGHSLDYYYFFFKYICLIAYFLILLLLMLPTSILKRLIKQITASTGGDL